MQVILMSNYKWLKRNIETQYISSGISRAFFAHIIGVFVAQSQEVTVASEKSSTTEFLVKEYGGMVIEL